MRIKRILGLGTFPAVKPIHGGQRRAAAFKSFYETIGIEYTYTCIYDSNHYAPPYTGPYDVPLVVPPSATVLANMIGDLLSGRQGADDEASFTHFVEVTNRLNPDALQLEQPFMWPLAKRLRQTAGLDTLPVIYSSYNVEAPLKSVILSSGGVPRDERLRLEGSIEEMEAEVCREAALVVCVSSSDRDHYRRYCKPEKVIMLPNGVDRPPRFVEEYRACQRVFKAAPFAFMVGSAYAPNIEGPINLLFRDGAFMVPPAKSIAICGGVSDGIFGHPLYQRFVSANTKRVEFFPKIEDAELWSVKNACHMVALPIQSGGGSNLKTAEALTLGKWVVATNVAMRGYEAFMDAEGVILANETEAFRAALSKTLRSAPFSIPESSRERREALYWDRCFSDSELMRRLSVLQHSQR